MKRYLLAAALALGACTLERGPRFQHLSHAGRGLTCRSCHPGVFQRADTAAQHKVAQERCTNCHADPHRGTRRAGPCEKCHGPAGEVLARETSPLVFSHPKHLARNRGQCFPCHNGVTLRASHTSRPLPAMATCLTCHQKKWDDMECGYCHQNLHVFPIRPVSQFAHEGDFLRTHARIAANRVDLCAQCHTQAYCASCHDPAAARLRPHLRWPERIDRSFIHRGDYVGRHAVEARSAGDACVRCHTRKECQGCHDQRGVGVGSGRNPHGPGWVSVTGGPNLHGPAARREIVACAGCHDQGAASNCVRCHRVGGVGGNPHPPGWKSRLSRQRDRVCRVCH